jgi:hypothetical protein
MRSSSGLRTRVVRDDAWSTEPQVAVCFVGLVRSHPWEVRRLAASSQAGTPLHPLTGWRSLPPTSLTGSALPLAHARATLGAEAVHGLRERSWLTTFGALHQPVGGGCLCAPGGSTGASARRSNAPTCPPGPCGAGAVWWLSPRPRYDAYYRGFRSLILPDHFPTMRSCATHCASLSRVLATPSLPATPPRFGNRWHHPRLHHVLLVVFSSKTRALVSQYRPR